VAVPPCSGITTKFIELPRASAVVGVAVTVVVIGGKVVVTVAVVVVVTTGGVVVTAGAVVITVEVVVFVIVVGGKVIVSVVSGNVLISPCFVIGIDSITVVAFVTVIVEAKTLQPASEAIMMSVSRTTPILKPFMSFSFLSPYVLFPPLSFSTPCVQPI